MTEANENGVESTGCSLQLLVQGCQNLSVLYVYAWLGATEMRGDTTGCCGWEEEEGEGLFTSLRLCLVVPFMLRATKAGGHKME